MVHSWSAAWDALEKMSSTTKTAFYARSFCSDSTVAPSSPWFPNMELHHSPPPPDEDDDAESGSRSTTTGTTMPDLSLCAITASYLSRETEMLGCEMKL
jgi:hypothetical protein